MRFLGLFGKQVVLRDDLLFSIIYDIMQEYRGSGSLCPYPALFFECCLKNERIFMKYLLISIIVFVAFSSISVLAQDSRPRFAIPRIPAHRSEQGKQLPPLPPSVFQRHRLEDPEALSGVDGAGVTVSGFMLDMPLREDAKSAKTTPSPEFSFGVDWMHQEREPFFSTIDFACDIWKTESIDGAYRAVISRDVRTDSLKIFVSPVKFDPSSISFNSISLVKDGHGFWVAEFDNQLIKVGDEFLDAKDAHYFVKHFSGLIHKGCGLPDDIVEAILVVYSQ